MSTTMSRNCPGKNVWPELVGKHADAAAATIEKENPKVKTIILPQGSGTTKDFRCDRVWVFVDDHHRVVEVPRIT
ncbi:proteinase inhibitor-like [Impatiens glandulifera]|uniref:proteinase inhibitor-like n=1 Tax=Impatiens glandulifera TaxID=253017 RepID=UPI001FB05BE1|nr:proteinase inhibitor-like [Impatiens glandulifera]